jgi:hypothetical protein
MHNFKVAVANGTKYIYRYKNIKSKLLSYNASILVTHNKDYDPMGSKHVAEWIVW